MDWRKRILGCIMHLLLFVWWKERKQGSNHIFLVILCACMHAPLHSLFYKAQQKISYKTQPNQSIFLSIYLMERYALYSADRQIDTCCWLIIPHPYILPLFVHPPTMHTTFPFSSLSLSFCVCIRICICMNVYVYVLMYNTSRCGVHHS